MSLIIINLAENALKYSHDNKLCRIDISYKVTSDKVKIFFSDNGIGIPPEARKWIFMEGFGADNAMAHRPVGTGYGLYQCKEFLEKINGEIDLIPDNSKTIFCVTLNRWEIE